MDENNDLQEFDLEDILNEFHDQAADAPQDDAQGILDMLDKAEEAALENAQEVMEEMTEAAVEAAEIGEDSDASMDTIRMNDIIAQIARESGQVLEEAEEDVVVSEETEEEQTVTEKKTIRMKLLERKAKEPSQDATIRLDAGLEAAESKVKKGQPRKTAPAPENQDEGNILYNPRTRLRELKKKLVAGPEKRYYELSEVGVGKMQIGILVNLALVALCAIPAVMYTMDMIPENRLRFVIFSQILAMLVSALLGCGVMLDGLSDLFHGKFSINTMLSFTFLACCLDGVRCLSELRIPCCVAFALEMALAQWAAYQRHSKELSEMDTMRKAVRLMGIVKEEDFYEGRPGLLRRDGQVEDLMEDYGRRSTPEIVQSIYCLLALLICIGISLLAGINHGTGMALQILSTALLVAVPASFFVTLTRPGALLERRLHMVGAVLCGWRGIKGLCGKAAFPLRDTDLFPANTTKLNGVKFYGRRDPDEVVSYTASVIFAAGGSLVSAFQKMQESRSCPVYQVTDFRDYGNGGVGAEVCGEPVLLGSLEFLQDMDVSIPEGTMVSQAVYAAIDGQLCAVFAISYAKMRSASAGIISLCGNRRLTPVITGGDFMITAGLLRAKFGVNTRRIAIPDPQTQMELGVQATDPETTTLALTTRDELVSYAYAVSGARALRLSCNLGMVIHLLGGILGMVIMAALAVLGSTELLTPTHVLLYQLVWMVPGLLITEWTRTV